MGIRALTVTLAALAVAPAALAQAVPPRVGPPVELAGSEAPTAPEPTTPTIPGGMDPLPKSRFVGPPKPEPPLIGERDRAIVDNVKAANKAAGTAVTVVRAGTNVYGDMLKKADAARDIDLQTGGGNIMDHPMADPYGPGIAKSNDLAAKTRVAGNIATGVSMVTTTVDVVDKCAGPNIDHFECTKAGAGMSGSYASGFEAATQSPIAGKIAKGLNTAADTMTAYQKCSDPKYSQLECAYATAKVVFDVAGFVPATSALSTTWALSTAGGEYLNSWAPDASVKLYDWLYADQTIIKDASASELAEIRRRRHEAYDRQKGSLIWKQEAYDAEQARLQAEVMEAAQRAGNPSGGVDFLNAFLSGLSGARAGAPAQGGGMPVIKTSSCPAIWMACANNGKTWAGYEKFDSTAANYTPSPLAAAKPTPAPAPRPPPVDTSCHPPPGKVCTAN